MLEDRRDARQMLRGADGEGEPRRRNFLASDVAAPARRARVIRALAVTGVILVAAGMALPSDASAQTQRPAQGQAVGILFLLGASRTGAQGSAKPAGQKPKPGIAASPEAQGKVVDMKSKPLAAKDRAALVRVGGGTAVSILDKADRPADNGTVLRVTTDQRNGQKLARPVEPEIIRECLEIAVQAPSGSNRQRSVAGHSSSARKFRT